MKSVERHSDLIIDVGLFDGGDTAYYLGSGYRVVAVEADPVKVELCTRKFSDAIAAQRLTIVNIGIAKHEGTLPFYRNLANAGWSSFFPEYGKREGRFEEISVRCTTLAEIVRGYGIPYYLKIDIEGMDDVAVATLDPDLLPDYISVELNLTSVILDRLGELGYKRFKLVNQEYHSTSTPIFDGELGWRLLRKLSRSIPPFGKAIRALPYSWRPKTEWDEPFSVNGQAFGNSSSGPFGESTHGRWLGYSDAKALHARIAELAGRSNQQLWWDVHAGK